MAQGYVTYDAGGMTGGLKALSDPQNAWTFFEDFAGTPAFRSVSAATGAASLLQYPGVMVSSDGTDANLKAVAAGGDAGGSIAFTPANGATHGLSAPACLISPNGGKRWFLEARVKVNLIASGFKFGLSENVSPTAILSGAGASVDGGATLDQVAVGFDTSTTTDGNLEYYISTNSTTGTHSGIGGMATVAQFVVDTYHRVGIEGDGDGGVRFYFDGNLVNAVNADENGYVQAGANCTAELCHPIIAADDDETTVEVDYLFVSCER
jgi:hypothetical protein